MRGDFSTFRKPEDNDQAVLYQQGRVTLDADLTASELIDLQWRAQAGRDVVGAGVAAVPAGDPEGFQVESAAVSGGTVVLGVQPGRIWADGLLTYLPIDPAMPTSLVSREAPYLPPPLNPAGTDAGSIGDGVRDAVILEVALEEINGFQDPSRLMEAALGGPDTAERLGLRVRFALLRLGPGETCTTIADKLADDASPKGNLVVVLEPPVTIPGDCPVVSGGGYSGMEHNLYRIEIAEVGSGVPRFLWSQFNGGLVGRGTFVAGGSPRCVITANRTAILATQTTDFYLEALQFDDDLGHWRVVYGTTATLNGAHDLDLVTPPLFGTFPSSSAGSVFFRLWNGSATVSSFAGGLKELVDGIYVGFKAAASYRPGDYWTFAVRAGEVVNQQILVKDAPPQGRVLRRVPLAEIDWTAAKDTSKSGAIEDCRHRFPSLTSSRTCCTLTVGDGVHTFGDFNSLEEAAAHLPSNGGELCLLGGLHYANLVLQNKAGVRIHGCPGQTRIVPHQNTPEQPIIHLVDCGGIVVRDLDLVNFFGPAVVAEGTSPGFLQDVVISDCRLDARTSAIRVNHGKEVVISGNRILLLDTSDGRNAIELRATRALVERNDLLVWSLFWPGPGSGGKPGGGGVPDPADPCAEVGKIYDALPELFEWSGFIWTVFSLQPPAQPYKAWGGIHLLGGCEQVRILENHIHGGAGHGITLGGLLPGDIKPPGPSKEQGMIVAVKVGASKRLAVHLLNEAGQALAAVDLYVVDGKGTVRRHDESDANGSVVFDAPAGSYTLQTGPGHVIVKAFPIVGRLDDWVVHLKEVDVPVSEEQGFLYEVTIQENEIERMALSGIGFLPFAEIAAASAPASTAEGLLELVAPSDLVATCNVVRDLVIRDNRIHDNLQVTFDQALRTASRKVGQGGISLAMVERVRIAGNSISDNGISAVDPVCGIFVGHGEDVEIDVNHVSGNGRIDGHYETLKGEGLRGGIVIRLASSFLVGTEAGARQQPALRIADNRIDQPAGRAVTAFVFGPASCVSNYLNSDRTGFMGVVDSFVGGVLIVDIGGYLRYPSSPTSVVAVGASATGGGSASGVGSPDVLPGGELLFNSNQVRLGFDNRSAVGVALATAGDLGCEGNQSIDLRPDLFFSNGLCFAPSLRVIGNRFREFTTGCYFSLLSVGCFVGPGSPPPPMNTTALNQGDHCIVATAMGPWAPETKLADQWNLEMNISARGGGPCAQYKGLNKAHRAALWDYVSRGIDKTSAVDLPSTEILLDAAVRDAAKAISDALLVVNSGYHFAMAGETARIVSVHGADSQQGVRARDRLARSTEALARLNLEAQLLTIEAVEPQEGGAVVEGRVTDVKQRGLPGYRVEVVRRDGTPVAPAASTESSGYFAVVLGADEASRLAGTPLFVRALDAHGTVVHRSDKPVEVAPDATTRVPITVTDVQARPTEDAGESGSPPTTSTPLETIRGVGRRTADRLRAAGIADVEALMRIPAAELDELAGKDAPVLRQHIEGASGAGGEESVDRDDPDTPAPESA